MSRLTSTKRKSYSKYRSIHRSSALSSTYTRQAPNSKKARFPFLYRQHLLNENSLSWRKICSNLQSKGFHVIRSKPSTYDENRENTLNNSIKSIKKEIEKKFKNKSKDVTTVFDHFNDYLTTTNNYSDRLMMIKKFTAGESNDWADLPFNESIAPCLNTLKSIRDSRMINLWKKDPKELNFAFILSVDNSLIQPLHSDFESKHGN
jgi:hypothetical protein